MIETLKAAFPSIEEKLFSNQYIKEHSDLMWDVPDVPLIKAVPLYMLWCVENNKDEGELVFSNTIGALNTYAREKSSRKGFKSACNKVQVEAVLLFLDWCKNSLLLDYEPTLSRAIKNWSNVEKTM